MLISEIKIKIILEKYVTPKGYIKIPSNTKDYITVSSYRARKGFKSLKELYEYMGYKYERLYDGISPLTYKDIIQKYIVYDNKVYIETSSRLYRKLGLMAHIYGLTLEEFIIKLGYERITKVPKGYSVYNWRTYELKTYPELYSDTTVISMIKEKYKEANEIFLLTKGSFYVKLRQIASVRNENLYTMLNKLGYIVKTKRQLN